MNRSFTVRLPCAYIEATPQHAHACLHVCPSCADILRAELSFVDLPSLLFPSGVITAGYYKLDYQFFEWRRRGSRVQLRIDGGQFRVQVGSGGHRHRITALVIGGRITGDSGRI
jgi:hypothetical protein